MKKPTLNFVHLCEAASSDSLNKLSILGIFNNIYFPSLPNRYPKICLVFSIDLGEITKKEYMVSVKLFSVDNEEIKLNPEIKFKFDVPNDNNQDNKPDLNLILELQNLDFSQFGEHKFVIFVDEQKVGEKKLLVEQKG